MSEPRTPYCPCGGTCHHSESPCSLGCWAAVTTLIDAALATTPAPTGGALIPAEEYHRALRLLWQVIGVVDGAVGGFDQSVRSTDEMLRDRALLALVALHRFFGMDEEGNPRSDQTPEQLARCEAAGFEVVHPAAEATR